MTDSSSKRSQFDLDGLATAGQLLPLVYDELRKLAAAKIAQEKPGHTLQATALVNEAYLRLCSGISDQQQWNGHAHFFAAAAEAMRRILVDSARRKNRQKRGGEQVRHDVEELEIAVPEVHEDLLALDEALDKLAQSDADAAKLVNLRYFAGLTLPEAAQILDISPRTAHRLWVYARAWLHQELQGPMATPPED